MLCGKAVDMLVLCPMAIGRGLALSQMASVYTSILHILKGWEKQWSFA